MKEDSSPENGVILTFYAIYLTCVYSQKEATILGSLGQLKTLVTHLTQ